MTVRSLHVRRWKVMALVTIHGSNQAQWWCVGRRLTEAGATRASARRAREGVQAAPAVLPVQTLGWGYCHEDDDIPKVVGLGSHSRPIAMEGGRE